MNISPVIWRRLRLVVTDASIGLVLFAALAFAVTFDKTSGSAPRMAEFLSLSARAAELPTHRSLVSSHLPHRDPPASFAAGQFNNHHKAFLRSKRQSAILMLAGVFAVLFAFCRGSCRHLLHLHRTPHLPRLTRGLSRFGAGIPTRRAYILA